MTAVPSQRFFWGLSALSRHTAPCVATIGNFDGVHRGHQSLVKQLRGEARRLGLPSLVMIFEPQPNEYFAQGDAPPRLMRLREKVAALMDAGVDRVLCLKFDATLRAFTPADYIQKVLVEGLQVRHLIIGDDFRFGCDRSGDFAMLKTAGRQFGFGVTATDTQREAELRISSTRIRACLARGDLDEAKLLLGREYTLCGRVVRGRQLGTQFGIPTANIRLGRKKAALRGVFAVRLSLTESPGITSAVANLGSRPTVDGTQWVLEVHALEAVPDLYGRFVRVTFLKKLRDEQKFDSLDALKAQIHQDRDTALAYFNC